MKDIINFLNVHYKNALKLVSDFDITKEKEWNPQLYLNELYVQLGHVYNVLFANKKVNESKRVIDNLGDELSDVLLQIINLAKIMNINMYDIKDYGFYKYDNINGISILLGQLTEAIMEIYECRFKKNRDGFDTSYDFIKDRLFKLFIITFNISKKYNLNMIEEFNSMLNDANSFLSKFKKDGQKYNEFIDIYDSNENLLGYCEKSKAHQLGYWHKVFGCLIYNSKKNKVFMQLKNPNHNKVNIRELLEITAGGHLISGETLNNGVREIKEETGFDVNYEDLTFLQKRKCNKTVSKDYKVKEFQYFYGLDLNVRVKDFKNFDTDEILDFVELDIHDLINLLKKRTKKIKGRNTVGKIISVDLNYFDKAFLKNGLYSDLIARISFKKGNKKMYIKLAKIYKNSIKAKKLHPEIYYFDNGQVNNTKEYYKDGIKYSIILLNEDVNTNKYIVSLLITFNNKSIPMQLKKNFNTKRGTNKYFKELCDYVSSNTNQDIVDKCYIEYKLIKKGSILKKIFN